MKYSPTIVFIALFALLSATHAATYNIVVDDFAGLNLGDANNLNINQKVENIAIADNFWDYISRFSINN